MTQPFQKLLPKLLPTAPGCPWNLAQAALRDAAREFCQRTLFWRAELPAVSLQAEQPLYAVSAPSGAELVMILSVEAAGRKLAPATDDWLDMEHPGWMALPAGTPSRYLLSRPGEVRLAPPPASSAAGGLRIRAALAPAVDAAETEDVLIDAWGRTLVHGALAALLEQLSQPWGNAELSLHHARQFRAGINDARSQTLKGSTPATLAARPRAFAQG